MPTRPKSICRQVSCSAVIPAPGYCDKHRQAKQKEQDRYRGTASERGYDSKWSKARKHYLRSHPLCVYCQRAGLVVPASVVDHIKPHKLKDSIDSGDAELIARARQLFWDSANWQSLCAPHHNSTKQREDRQLS